MEKDTKITIILGLVLATLIITLDIIGIITLTY